MSKSKRKVAAGINTERSAASGLLPTGIGGLDEVLGGGVPRGRTILVVGEPGCGKSLLGCEFLARGARDHDEPGVLISFEERAEDVVENTARFSWGFPQLVETGRIRVHFIELHHSHPTIAGEFDLSGLKLRIEAARDAMGAGRVVIDGLNQLMAMFGDTPTMRSELLSLFNWLRAQGLTTLVTGERGTDSWSALGFEEYLADTLIALGHHADGRSARRLLRVVKSRGVDHSRIEHSFVLGEDGFELYPIDKVTLDYKAPKGRIGTGIEGLDEMLGGRGLYRGSVTMVSGTAGTGKTSIAACFVAAACERGEKALLVTLEQAESQIIRDMKTIGVDLAPKVQAGQLTILPRRATQDNIEAHLLHLLELIRRLEPAVVAIDPISAFLGVGSDAEIRAMITRLISACRGAGVTLLLTNLASGGQLGDSVNLAISSMADTWIRVRTIEQNAERNNVVQIVKSRGMSHSRELREFRFTRNGLQVVDAYIGLDGVVIGSARVAQEAKDELAELERARELERKEQVLSERRAAIDAQIKVLEKEHEAERKALQLERAEFEARAKREERAVAELSKERDGK